MSESKLVKTVSMTPTYHPTLSTQTETESLSNRVVPSASCFGSAQAVFYFGFIAPWGAVADHSVHSSLLIQRGVTHES
jgi:hypothetical protein